MKNETKKIINQDGQSEIGKKVGEFKSSLNVWGLASQKLLDTFSPKFNPLLFTKAIESGLSINRVFKDEIGDAAIQSQIAPKMEELIDTFYTLEQKKELIEKLKLSENLE